MATRYEFLAAARITNIMQGLQDPRLLSQQLIWNQRIPDVPAMDEEIMARFIGQVLIADLIADDAKAVVYSQGKFQFETTKIPNLKLGIAMNQTMLGQLRRLEGGFAGEDDAMAFTNWENRTVDMLNLGIQQRKEALKVAMLLDGFSYNRLGIIMNNVTWGMPSNLKVTSSVAWSSTSGTPLTDILTTQRLARVQYGANLNRVTMSTQAFQYAIATTEFQNQAKIFGFGLAGVPAPVIPLQSDTSLQQLMSKMLGGMQIELYDARYWTQGTDGNITSAPFLPINQVILTDSGNDGNAQAYDFANGIVDESIVSSVAPINVIGGGTGPTYGPYAYASAEHNPPGLTYWGVAKGFPRKKLLQSSAALTVGTFVDTIPVGVPFPQ
jgi:hypothetical protein